MLTEQFKKLFPKLVEDDSYAAIKKQIKSDFKEAVKNYGLYHDKDKSILHVSGEDYELKVRHDLNENLELVYEAIFITQCPKRVVSSDYHATVDKALKTLSKSIKF